LLPNPAIEELGLVEWFTLTGYRRGGITHCLDVGVKRWKATAHGRWDWDWQARSGLDMTDLYDATGTDRKLEVTEVMG
jgi:hypothetical protein